MTLITVPLLWGVMSQVYATVKQVIIDQADETTRAHLSNVISIADAVWSYFPLILLFGVILWAVVQSMRREPHEYYY